MSKDDAIQKLCYALVVTAETLGPQGEAARSGIDAMILDALQAGHDATGVYFPREVHAAKLRGES